jgi:hypothetical protein
LVAAPFPRVHFFALGHSRKQVFRRSEMDNCCGSAASVPPEFHWQGWRGKIMEQYRNNFNEKL